MGLFRGKSHPNPIQLEALPRIGEEETREDVQQATAHLSLKDLEKVEADTKLALDQLNQELDEKLGTEGARRAELNKELYWHRSLIRSTLKKIADAS